MLLLLALGAAGACPDGWTGSATSAKCMRLIEAVDTHEGCEGACSAVGGSLVCIQSQADDALAAQVSPPDVGKHVWTGEYQWPVEPSGPKFGLECPYTCFANQYANVPYNGQTGWGTCSNGQRTNFTPSVLGFQQPNNFNAGEDCVSRAPDGYGDNGCTQRLPCLCESGRTTSAAYLSEIGPALTLRATEASALLYGNLVRTEALAAALGSLPALLFVLLVELFQIRWRQRAAPSTADEAKLRATIRLALRRRMLQSGLSMWLGGMLFAMSLPPQRLYAIGAWPQFGMDFPVGAPILWRSMHLPGVLLLLLTVLPSWTLTIRLAAVAWPLYVVSWWASELVHPPPWAQVFPKSDAAVATLGVLRSLGVLASLRVAIFWARHALPGRLALRWLWYCVRLEILVSGVDFLLDSLPFMRLPIAAYVGTPMVVPAALTIAFAVGLTERMRRRLQGALGGCGARARDASAASVVQTMVSGDAVAAIRDAHARLYTIAISRLDEADMADNQDSGLFARTARATAGECDAFLSHSWRDDAHLKWQRMCEYKADFEKAHQGREPTCWLDKACIDQAGDINASLRALPIFLLASNHFVVLAGASYMRRMWCVLELFTYVRSGGALEAIVLKPLKDDEAHAAIASLDVRRAECFLREDRQRILAIVESSYGSSEQFNSACAAILAAKLGTTLAEARWKAASRRLSKRVSPERYAPSGE